MNNFCFGCQCPQYQAVRAEFFFTGLPVSVAHLPSLTRNTLLVPYDDEAHGRKWAVSTQNQSQSNKHKCAACTMCGHQLTPGEQRLQQWANNDAQRAYVHGQCITGCIGLDHELVPKVPADIEARDAVIHLRDSVLSAAAAGSPDPRSTRPQFHGGSGRRRTIVRQGGGAAPR